MENVILKATNVRKYFFGRKTLLSRTQRVIKAVDGVDFEVNAGRIVAIIGESGCGKSTLGYTLTRIYRPTEGSVYFDGEDISRIEKADLKRIRCKIQMIFQNVGASLNPRHSIGSIISLPLRIHHRLSKAERTERVRQLLDLVNLPQDMMVRYPISLSGGEKQRVGIARALALHPKLVVLDEPTSALDVSVQAKVLHLLGDLQMTFDLTYILITHNLSLTKNLADRVMVMYLGKIVEMADVAVVFENPLHPYTKALLSAIPVVKEEEKSFLPDEVILEGDIPSPANPPITCPFLSRCQEKKKICEKSLCPELIEVEPGHFVRCHL